MYTSHSRFLQVRFYRRDFKKPNWFSNAEKWDLRSPPSSQTAGAPKFTWWELPVQGLDMQFMQCMIGCFAKPDRLRRAVVRILLVSALFFVPCASDGQIRYPTPGSIPYPTALSNKQSPITPPTTEIPPEEIFSRFASRILFLTCDLSGDDLKQASGVLISADGFVVTNAHVVEGCRNMTAIQITGSSRHSYQPLLKYYDQKSDTAVLKIDGGSFESFDVRTRTVRVGERVYAIGNPRGLEQSISEGIVSGLRTDEDGRVWIQHSAPISPGSSGGALISSRGELLGINSWSVKESQGLNFAVPASTLARAYSDARDKAGFLRFPDASGVLHDPSPPDLLNLPPATVSLPRPDTPAPPPAISQPPLTSPEQDPVVRKAAGAISGFAEAIRNIVCHAVISRYKSDSRPISWSPIDVVTTDVLYENGKEDYRNITINGKPATKNLEQTGVWSTGEFGALLIDLFSPATAADFIPNGESRIAGVATKMYSFDVKRENSHWTLHFGSQTYVPAYKGTTWIDPATGRVLRIEMEALGLPADFAADHVETATDYAPARLGAKGTFLVPNHAETLSCQRGTSLCFKNSIDFREYRAYTRESEIGSVRLNVTVSDKSGRRLPDLPQSAFTVFENGTAQQIKLFQTGEVPLSEGIILDGSANMRGNLASVKAAGLALVEDSNPEDEVFVINFNDEAYLDLPHDKDFTSDIKEMEEALTRIDSRGGTAMRDAVRKSIDHEKAKAHRDKKVLVVVASGADDSSIVSLEKLVKIAEESGLIIYSIGLPSEQGRRETKNAKQALEVLAATTGGEAFFPRDLAEVERVAHQVAHDIRDQYTIVYSPSNQAIDSTFRAIKVVVKAPGNPVAQTRRGYYATKDGL
jgi:Ca-activated chloride channel homolog